MVSSFPSPLRIQIVSFALIGLLVCYLLQSYISPQVQTQPHPRPSARCICQYFGPELQGRRIGGPVNQRAEGLEGCRQTNMLKITN